MGQRFSTKGFSVVELILIVAILAVLSTAGYLFYKRHHTIAASAHTHSTTKPTSTACSTNVQTIKQEQNNYGSGCYFSGLVTSNGCIMPGLPVGDVGCSIKVGNATIDVMHGNIYETQPWGVLTLTNTRVGDRVQVYAHQLSVSSFTLEGSTSYYLKAAD